MEKEHGIAMHRIIVIGVAAIVPHNAMADNLMDDISRFVEENTEAEILDVYEFGGINDWTGEVVTEDRIGETETDSVESDSSKADAETEDTDVKEDAAMRR